MPDSLILTHGAGSNREAPLLVAVDAALSNAGLDVVRMNLPFRDARPKGSPRPGDAQRDREGLAEAVRDAARSHDRVFLGGHSYGGRQSSMLAAEQPDLVSGLLLMSYPLHPPGRHDQLRTAHLGGIRVPVLFVHGARDPFGSVEELRAAIGLIPGRTALTVIEGSGHELAPRRAGGIPQTAATIAHEFIAFIENKNPQL